MSSPRSNASDGGSGGNVFRLPRLAAMDEPRSASPPSAASDLSARSTSAHFEAAARRASVTYRPDYTPAPKLSPLGLGGLPPFGGRSERSAFFQDMPPQRALPANDLNASPSARSSDRLPAAEGSTRQHRAPTLPEPLARFKRPSDEASFGTTRLPPLYSRTMAAESHLPAHSPHRASSPPRLHPATLTHPSGSAQPRGEEAFRQDRVVRPPGPVHSHSQPHISGMHLHMASTSYPTATGSSSAAMPLSGRKAGKQHVPSACLNCKRAHLACDVGRPCRRCVNLGKSDTCIDVVQKKRGRPRLKDREAAAAGSPLPVTSHQPAAHGSMQPRQASGAVGPALHTPEGVHVALHREAAPPQHSFRRYSEAGDTGPWAAAAAHHGPGQAWARRESIDGHDAMHAPRSIPQQLQVNHGRGRSWSSAAVLPHATEPPVHAREVPYTPATSTPAAEPVRHAPTVSLICSTELQCVRASEECSTLLGLRPEELQQLSLFDLVHPTEGPQLEDLWQSLIRPVGIRPSGAPAHPAVILNAPPAQLLLPAAGTVFVENTFRVRLRSGTFDFYSVRLHLGGYFGADLFLPETLGRAYVVASLLKLGNDATHPSIAVLRNAAQDETHERSPAFRTPVGLGESAAARERSTPRAAYGQHFDEVQQRGNVSTHGSSSHSGSPRDSLPTRRTTVSSMASSPNPAKRSDVGDALPSPKRQRTAVEPRMPHVPRYVGEGVPC